MHRTATSLVHIANTMK